MNITNLMESQTRAAKTIEKKFGLRRALDFLIEETLYFYLEEQKKDEAYTEDLPLFIKEIKNQYGDKNIQQYLSSLKEETLRKTKMLQALEKALKLSPSKTRRKKCQEKQMEVL